MNKLYTLLLSLLIVSCGDNTSTTIEDCSRFDEISAFLDSVIDAEDFVTSFDNSGNNFIIEFNKSNTLIINRDCISNFEIIDTNTLLVDMGDQGTLSFPYLEYNLFELNYNPLGWTPLSASLTVNSRKPGTVKVTIAKKNSDGTDLTKSHRHNDMDATYPVLGLYYNHTNEILIEWISSDTTRSETIIIETPIQPDFIPEINITTIDTAAMEPGMTFIAYRAKENPSVPFMLDHNGELRYILDYTGHPDLKYLNYDVGLERLENGNFYFGHWPTNKLYEVDIFGEIINKWELTGYTFHHNVQEKENGNLLVTVSKNGSTHLNGSFTIEDHIVELDRNTGLIAHVWDLRESMGENRAVQSVNMNAEYIDWIHANAVIEDPSDNTIIVSCRKQGIVKLNYDNEVQWIMNNHFRWGRNRRGEDLNQFLLTPLDNYGSPITDQRILNGLENHEDFEWSWFQHAPFVLEGNRLFCFDNGDRRNYDGQQKYSRAVEYIIDQDNMTVQQIWTYGKERGLEAYSNIVSDVDYLPQQNNILFAPGSGVSNGVGKLGGKVIEIDYDTKNVVFEMSVTAPYIVWHRVERMPLYPD